MATLTFNPDAHVEATSVDGFAGEYGRDESFATLRARSGATSADNGVATNNLLRLYASTTSNQFQAMARGFFLFDTSSILAGGTITSATLRICSYGKTSGLGNCDLVICTGTPASNKAIANGDYAIAKFGSSELGSIAHASWPSAGTYAEIALPTSAVVKAGITKLGALLRWDFENNFTGTWASNARCEYGCYFADNGSNKPELVVVGTDLTGAIPVQMNQYRQRRN